MVGILWNASSFECRWDVGHTGNGKEEKCVVALDILKYISLSFQDVDLRLQHFHSFSDKWAGHYHYDTTPDIVEYEGYFNIGEKVVRVDKPKNTHQLGRDWCFLIKK